MLTSKSVRKAPKAPKFDRDAFPQFLSYSLESSGLGRGAPGTHSRRVGKPCGPRLSGLHPKFFLGGYLLDVAVETQLCSLTNGVASIAPEGYKG